MCLLSFYLLKFYCYVQYTTFWTNVHLFLIFVYNLSITDGLFFTLPVSFHPLNGEFDALE